MPQSPDNNNNQTHYKIHLWLNGQPQVPFDNKYYQVLSPNGNQVISEAASAIEADVQVAVSQAAMAFASWSQMQPNTRRDILLKASDLLLARQQEFIERMCAETGATTHWAEFNCQLGAEMLRSAAMIPHQIKGEVIPSNKPETLSMALRQPVGICLAMAPWNAPIILGCRSIAAALACGNCVIFKASELCPATHYLLGEILSEAGLPPGVLSIISNSQDNAAEVVSSLIEHPAIRHINFTGSTRIGKIIAELAARKLKRCLLELGGKAPVLVLDDADLDQTAKAIVFGAFMNSGQICMSTERILVSDKVADQLTEKILQQIQTKSQENTKTANSRIISEQAAQHILQLIKDAELKGAHIVRDGRTNDLNMNPTVIDHICANMALYREESFGPLVCIIRVQDEEEAISIANDTSYGLAASIFSKDISRAMSIMARIESGICHINGPTLHDEPHVPFGGVKDSGYGRFGGEASINEFTELRRVTVNT